MQFTLVGFSQQSNIRHFCFERVAADRTRIRYTVDADLVALRSFRISMQELPLMCRRLLENLPEGAEPCALTLSERDMYQHAATAAAAVEQAAQRRKTLQARRPTPPSTAFGQFRIGRPVAEAPAVRPGPSAPKG